MSILQPFVNYVSRVIQNGDSLTIDAVMIDSFGNVISPQVVDPDDPEQINTLQMTWWLQNKDTGAQLSYTLGKGITIVDNDRGQVQLKVAPGILESQRGFLHRMVGYWPGKEDQAVTYISGSVDTITPGIASLANSP